MDYRRIGGLSHGFPLVGQGLILGGFARPSTAPHHRATLTRAGQFGHGLPVIKVRWSTVSDVLAPDMTALAQG